MKTTFRKSSLAPVSLPVTAAQIRDFHPADFTLHLPGGVTAQIKTERDDDTGAPWENCDGHGTVSEWTTREKRAGERVLCSDGRSKRFYDYAEAIRTAKRDGWGLNPATLAELAAKLGRAPTKGEICAASVEHDFAFLQGWVNDSWEYLGVIVTLFDAEGVELGEESCWGIESCENPGHGYYWQEIAADYVNSLFSQHCKEQGERAYWEARDVETVAA